MGETWKHSGCPKMLEQGWHGKVRRSRDGRLSWLVFGGQSRLRGTRGVLKE